LLELRDQALSSAER